MINGRFISDVDLLSQIQSDDEQALLVLMQKYDRSLFRYIRSKTNSLESAEEAVQDIFISLWNNRHSIVINDSLSPYLFKSAKHKVIDFYIANSKNITCHDILLPEYDHLTVPSAENLIIDLELNDWLSGEVNKMPDNIRNVFRLSRIEQLPVKEIASKLSLSEQTVKNNLSIALKRLHARLQRMESISMLLVAFKIFFYFK
ncbi:sigma-70 family RNA polymerase sigma factor [Mucilaginibacter sabulilitoris]|uniref:Sigma-70 family RNA polymerase sigma factor n=1 Tax=Mucilaginibacter sabulilitoris TaxID=1173583 RepID=A0ABZ0THY1_9SPHI|nr:sigma-70 family RNA polymerase sigma factor [Mucilaginibacter sabulilitoris]WPU92805.1 sigma-70 family RNA polymerase sigma factor [Mucilaginibacter sabulilitoris]